MGIRLADFRIEVGRIWEGDYMRLIVDKARELKPQTFKAKAQVNFTTKTLGHLADRYGIAARVAPTPPRRLKIQAYADNFR